MFNFKEEQKILDRAARKLNYARKTLIGDGQYRNEEGYAITANRICRSQENFLNMPSALRHDLGQALSNGIFGTGSTTNFSRKRHFANSGAGDVNNVGDIDVVDISIAATVASHGLTYVAMERPMEAQGTQITFQGLKAVNAINGFSAGETVFDPRKGLPTNLDLSRNAAEVEAEVSGTSAQLGTGVIRGTTKVVVVALDSSNKVLGESSALAFDTGRDVVETTSTLLSKNGNFVVAGSVDLATGAVTITTGDADEDDVKTLLGLASTPASFKYKVISCADRITENDGAHTLKLRPFMDTATLQATENRIILQSSVEIQSQMNKILRQNAQYGIDIDYGKRAIDQIVALYSYSIDAGIIRELWNGVSKKDPLTLDLSGFGTGSWAYNANVKNDALSRFVDQLCSKLLMSSGQPVTALICDDVAAQMFSSDKESFIPDPAFLQRRDGFVGTYKGIPVVRNYVLHGKADEIPAAANHSGLGCVIGVFKSADGQCAPVAFGDYLPPYSTLPALNPANPGELAQALFSSTATKSVVSGWSVLGVINPYNHAM